MNRRLPATPLQHGLGGVDKKLARVLNVKLVRSEAEQEEKQKAAKVADLLPTACPPIVAVRENHNKNCTPRKSPCVASSPHDVAGGSPSPQRKMCTPNRSSTTPCSKVDVSSRHCTPVPELWPLTGGSKASAISDEFVCEALADEQGCDLVGLDATEDWQFEILNHFPRERAIDLVGHLRSVEMQRSRAALQTAYLTAEVSRLKEQLHMSGKANVAVPKLQSSRSYFLFGLALMTVMIMLVASLVSYFSSRASVVTSPACDPDKVAQMSSENEFMKWEFQRMQGEIDDAVKQGRSVICWPLN